MNSTPYLSSSTTNPEETDLVSMSIKQEPESLIEQIFIYSNTDFSDSYDKNPKDTLQIKPMEDKNSIDDKSLLNCLKYENDYHESDGEEKENVKQKPLKNEIKVEQVVYDEKDFQVIGEGTNVICISEPNRESVENTEENTHENAHSIQELYNVKCQEIEEEENESLQCMKEEVLIKFDDLNEDDLVRHETVEGELYSCTHSVLILLTILPKCNNKDHYFEIVICEEFHAFIADDS